jgi:hypothetical protein
MRDRCNTHVCRVLMAPVAFPQCGKMRIIY